MPPWWYDPGAAVLAARGIYDARWPRLEGEDEERWRRRQARLASAGQWDPRRPDPRGRWEIVVRRLAPGRPLVAREIVHAELSGAVVRAATIAEETLATRGWPCRYEIRDADAGRVVGTGEARP